MKNKRSRLLRASRAMAAGATALVIAAYRKEIQSARQRVQTGRRFIDSPHGPIEFAESGNGPAVLVIHGAGGGFDQGLDLGRLCLGDSWRIIAPSRFGYLGTALPADASPEAQADAHLRLLDALELESVPVIGVSAGGPSAMQLCLTHPSRCSALALIVPMAFTPERDPVDAPSPFFAAVLNTISASDFLFWSAMKVAHSTLLRTILGTPVADYRNASAAERAKVDATLRSVLPISRRAAGIRNDGVVSSHLTRYPLEQMHVPTLVMSVANDLYGTYESSLYTAEQIHDGKFVGFPTGGHLLLGHDAEVRSEVTTFLQEHAAPGKAAMAV